MARPLAWMTYVAAAAAGWIGVSMLQRPDHGETGAPAKAAGTTSSPGSPAPGEILARLEAETKAIAGTGGGALSENLDARIGALRKSLAPADDPAAAALQAFEKMKGIGSDSPEFLDEKTLARRLEVSVRVIQWLEADPEAALRHMGGMTGYQLTTSGGAYGLETWAREAKGDAVLAAAKSPANSNVAHSLALGLGKQVGERGNLAELEAYNAQLQGNGLGNVREELARSALTVWPQDRAAELLPLAMDDSRFLAAVLKRMPPRDSLEWINSALATGNQAEVLKSLQLNGFNAHYDLLGKDGISFAEALALTERLRVASGMPPGDAKSSAIQGMALMSLSNLLTDGTLNDVMFSFKQGEIDARSVLEAMSAALPDLAAAAPDQLRDGAFTALAKTNPTAALEILAGLPEEERYRQIAQFSQNTLAYGDPKHLLELFEAVPFNPQFGPLQDRFQAWGNLTRRAYSTYGDDYSAWIRRMPAGVNRDMALSALAGQIEKSDPALAAALRAEKTQP